MGSGAEPAKVYRSGDLNLTSITLSGFNKTI